MHLLAAFAQESTVLDINLAAFLSFAFVTTFTPGPNNVSSASLGVLHGYRKALKYIAGIVTGLFLIMLLCGWVSTTLLTAFPSFEKALRFIGAGYILWLAFETLRSSYTFSEGDQAPMGFANGFVLQALNPKVIVYGLAQYSTFLKPLVGNPVYLVCSAMFLAGVAFCSTSTWALFGSAIRAHLHQRRVRQFVNLTLSLLLVYSAVELAGLVPAIL
jgi:cysteine/O-acetylserine efflux protein